jgi:hypothetical protein
VGYSVLGTPVEDTLVVEGSLVVVEGSLVVVEGSLVVVEGSLVEDILAAFG